ncbi:MAG: hypothetical protein JO147_11380 [Actinobacteria bacterium]|nr:hypothetical protein [Actinomycetota bacterium]
MSRRRLITIAISAALAVGGLSACQTKTGAAAFVGSKKISESQVTSYIEPGSSTTAPVHALVLEQIIRVDLLDEVFRRLGRTPSAADLAAAHDAALQQALGVQSTGAAADADLRSVTAKLGLRPSFDSVIVEAFELLVGVSNASDSDQNRINGIVTSVKVNVSGRYGDWDSKNLQLVAGPSIPSFIDLPGVEASKSAAANGG